MKASTIAWILVVIIIIAGGWYWWMYMQTPAGSYVPPGQEVATTTPSGADTGSSSNAAYIPGNLLLGTDATTTLGTYLIASNGMTLYTYAKDTAGVSNCTGQCAAVWPPYTVVSTDVLANVQAGISGTVGTVARADGSLQVTYKGMPLYFYAKDQQSGDVTGQNVGGVWFVVKP